MSDAPPLRPVQPIWKVILGLLTMAAWAPLGLAIAASIIASSLGCTLNEAEVHACIMAGHDIGHSLYTMAMMMWLAILAFPLMAVTAVGWIIVWVRRARTPRR